MIRRTLRKNERKHRFIDPDSRQDKEYILIEDLELGDGDDNYLNTKVYRAALNKGFIKNGYPFIPQGTRVIYKGSDCWYIPKLDATLSYYVLGGEQAEEGFESIIKPINESKNLSNRLRRNRRFELRRNEVNANDFKGTEEHFVIDAFNVSIKTKNNEINKVLKVDLDIPKEEFKSYIIEKLILDKLKDEFKFSEEFDSEPMLKVSLEGHCIKANFLDVIYDEHLNEFAPEDLYFDEDDISSIEIVSTPVKCITLIPEDFKLI